MSITTIEAIAVNAIKEIDAPKGKLPALKFTESDPSTGVTTTTAIHSNGSRTIIVNDGRGELVISQLTASGIATSKIWWQADGSGTS